MKKLITQINLLTLIGLFFATTAFSQEYDDIYFRKKDRIKKENSELVSTKQNQPATSEKNETIRAFDKTTNPEYLSNVDTITTDTEDDKYFEEGYESQTTSKKVEEYMDNADVVVKHYYYGYPSTRYYSDFDDVFWSDPFLYQGTVFDPFYDPYYRSSAYYRPGWNFSMQFGSGYQPYHINRYRYNSYYRSYNYGYGWGGYYDPWYSYYDPYWCPPSYYNYNNNVIVFNNEGSYNSRGVVRGKRSSRNSAYNGIINSRSGGNGIVNNDTGGRGSTNGRTSGDNNIKIKTRGNGRTASSSSTNSNYSGFRRSSSSNDINSEEYNNNLGTRNNRSTNKTSESTSPRRSTITRSSGTTPSYGSRDNKSNASRNTRNYSGNSNKSRNNSYGSSSRSNSSSRSGSSYKKSSSTRSSSSGSRSSSSSSSKRKKN